MKYGFGKSVRIVFLGVLTIVLIITGFVGCGGNTQEDQDIKKTYDLDRNEYGFRKFTNNVDGYSLTIPKGMKVDMSLSEIRAVLSNDEEQIEIYRQEFKPKEGITAQSYTNYSNLFLENDTDHDIKFNETIYINGYYFSIAKWSREPLKMIEDDKCHYVSVEIFTSEEECFTLLFKSSEPYDSDEETQSYMKILKSFALTEKTAQGVNRKIQKTKNPYWNEKTNKAYEKYFGENEKLTWGIFDKEAPVDFTMLHGKEKDLEFNFPILLYYTGFIEGENKHPRLAGALKNAKKNNRMLELTLQTLMQENDKGNMVYDVLNGKYDEYLKSYVKDIKAYGEPILFRVGNEMNGDWCVYSAYHTSKDTEIYKAFYKYIYGIFKDAGADNVIWVWNPNAKSFPDFKWNDALCYYPGDEYVDVIGMTNYNTGTYFDGEEWIEFADLYDDLYAEYERTYDKPLMITEFASSSVGGDKAAWVTNMFEHIKNYENLKVAIWWSSCDYDAEGNISRPYFMDETEEIKQIFRENLSEYK